MKGKKRLAAEREDLEASLTVVVSQREGRVVLRWIAFELCRMNAGNFDPDPHVGAFREGHRNVGLMVLNEIGRVDPGALQQLVSEDVESTYMIVDEKESEDARTE